MSDTQMGSSIGARNAIGRQTGFGTSRTKRGTTCGLKNGQRPIRTPHRNGITKSTKRSAQPSILSGQERTGRSEMLLMHAERLQSYVQRLHGRIRMQSCESTPRPCTSRKKLESESTLTISCHCKARSFAACTLSRTFKYSTGRKMRASAISDGRTCHSRIEQAYAQPRLFEDKVGAGGTAVQGDMLLPANAIYTHKQ